MYCDCMTAIGAERRILEGALQIHLNELHLWWRNRKSGIILSAYALAWKLATSVVLRPNRVRK